MFVFNEKRFGESKRTPIKILYQRLIISRIYVVLSIFISSSSFLFDKLTNNTTFMWTFFILFVCLVAMIDIIINDICSDKYYIDVMYDFRHIIYMMLAIINISLSVSVIMNYGSSFNLYRMWLDGIVAAIVAFLDILGRYREKRGQ